MANHAKFASMSTLASNSEYPLQVESGSAAPAECVALVEPSITPAPYFRYKGILGRILAAILLIPGAPIIGLLVLLVRLTSKGPGIYRQVRVGLHGKTFNIYKIRTMRHDAEAQTGPTWTTRNDGRITWLGKRLRKWHLDEFPQLFNVLRGDMTLIGPRPERPEFIQWLAQEIPDYLERLAVRPGITGLAQINLPPDTDVDSVRRKLVLDLEYIRHATLLLDLRMFAGTLLRLFGVGGEWVMNWTRLRREVVLPREPARQGVHGANGHATAVSLIPTAPQDGELQSGADGARSSHADNGAAASGGPKYVRSSPRGSNV